MPSSDATGDWLRRMNARELSAGESETNGSAGLQRVKRSVFRRLPRQDDHESYPLDIDATRIVAEKRDAQYTYKGEKGHMPMVGHIAELGLVAGYEFREGNAAPAARNLEFMQACERNMPKGKKVAAVRADSAAYQATIFNWCEETGKVFAIGADQDIAVKAAIKAIPEGDWQAFREGQIAETVHCMSKTDKAFRLIVMRRPRDQDLFEERSPWRYHAVASNRENEEAAATMEWYSKRGETSENRIKDLKIGFGMDYMPCGTFSANAVFFSIGVLTYNLYLGFRSAALGSGWERAQVQTVRARTVRWRLFQTAGKIVLHGRQVFCRQVFLKISAAMLRMFAAIRERCALIMQEGGAAQFAILMMRANLTHQNTKAAPPVHHASGLSWWSRITWVLVRRHPHRASSHHHVMTPVSGGFGDWVFRRRRESRHHLRARNWDLLRRNTYFPQFRKPSGPHTEF